MEMNDMEYLFVSPAPDPDFLFPIETPVPNPDFLFSTVTSEPDFSFFQEIQEPQIYADDLLLEKLDQIHQDLSMVSIILLVLLFRGIFKRYSSNIKGRY